MTKRKNIPNKTIINTVIKQGNKCANRPGSNIRNIGNFECPRWKFYNGLFNEDSGFEVDHILEISVGGNNDEKNIQILCLDCHRVKTKNFRANLAERNEKEKDEQITDDELSDEDELEISKLKSKNNKKFNSNESNNFIDSDESDKVIMSKRKFNEAIEHNDNYIDHLENLLLGKKGQVIENELKSKKTEIEFKNNNSSNDDKQICLTKDGFEKLIKLRKKIQNKHNNIKIKIFTLELCNCININNPNDLNERATYNINNNKFDELVAQHNAIKNETDILKNKLQKLTNKHV